MKKMIYYSKEVSYTSTSGFDAVINKEIENGGEFVNVIRLNTTRMYGEGNLFLLVFKKYQ
jgi:hypothetical protein